MRLERRDIQRTANSIVCTDIVQNKMVLERYPSNNWIIRGSLCWLPAGDNITQEAPGVRDKLNPLMLHYVRKGAFYVKKEKSSTTSGL